MIRDSLPRVAKAAAERGEAAMDHGNDVLAVAMFRISEKADELYHAMEQAEADGLVEELAMVEG